MKLFTIANLLLLAGAASCRKAEHQVHHYQRIVVVGNSITRHPPKPEIGWKGDWGMAASSPDSAFVAILARRFKQETPTAQVKFQNIAEWERNYWKYDLHRLDTVKQFNPDLLIVRLGENIKGDSMTIHGLDKQFPRLLHELAGPTTHVVVVSSFWSDLPATPVLKKLAEQEHEQYIYLDGLDKIPGDKATGQFSDAGVAGHPSNKGHRAIANIIWQNI
jgi:hypothetical protein